MKQKMDLLGHEVTIHNERELIFYDVTKKRCYDIVQYKDDPYFLVDNEFTDKDMAYMLSTMADEISHYIQAMFFLDMIPNEMPHVFRKEQIIEYYSQH